MHLVVRNQGSLNGPEDYLEMPKIIRVAGQDYQLGMLTMFDRCKCHFTSMHYVDEQFVYYDGRLPSKRKFRRTLPSDYKQSNIYLDHALYVRLLDNKQI